VACGVYCDPPWRWLGDCYVHSFTDSDHCALSLLLERFHDTTVVIRYGDDPLIRELYQHWHIIDAASRTQTNAIKGEIWITNRPSP
jgi:site-specific DNA-adenine methylase